MLNAFKDIISNHVVINIDTSQNSLTLIEKATNSKIQKLHITGLPEQSFAFTLDHQPKNNRCFKQLSCYVHAGKKFVNKGSDLVIVFPENNQYNILILDIKSDKLHRKDDEKQFINSELYICYVISMIREYDQCADAEPKISRTIVKSQKLSGANKDPIYKNDNVRGNYPFFIKEICSSTKKENTVHFKSLFPKKS